jgi:hypothetical protein
VGFTGAYECADSWHETDFWVADVYNGGAIDSARDNFLAATLKTYSARYRVQGVKSPQCEDGLASQFTGLLIVQSSHLTGPGAAAGRIVVAAQDWVATTLVNAGKDPGNTIKWDQTNFGGQAAPGGTTPEGGIR